MQPDGEERSVLVYVDGGNVGDMLTILPGLRSLRRGLPGHRLVVCTGRSGNSLGGVLAPLAAGVVDELIDEAGIGERWSELWRRHLPGRRFDILVDAQTRLRTTLVLRRISHRLFISAAVRFMLSDRRARGPRPAHVLDRFMRLVELAVGKPCEPDFRFDLPADARAAAAALLPGEGPFIGLAPGAGDRRKCWPLERFLDIAREQARRGRVPVFLLGPDEVQWRAEIAAAVPAARIPEEAPGTACLRDAVLTMAIGERLAASVTNDAGVGHIVAVARKPLVTLFGRTSPDKFAIRTVPRWQAVEARRFGGPEIERIPVAAVQDALERVLTREDPSP